MAHSLIIALLTKECLCLPAFELSSGKRWTKMALPTGTQLLLGEWLWNKQCHLNLSNGHKSAPLPFMKAWKNLFFPKVDTNAGVGVSPAHFKKESAGQLPSYNKLLLLITLAYSPMKNVDLTLQFCHSWLQHNLISYTKTKRHSGHCFICGETQVLAYVFFPP